MSQNSSIKTKPYKLVGERKDIKHIDSGVRKKSLRQTYI